MQVGSIEKAIGELLVELGIDLVSIGDVVTSAIDHGISGADVRPFAEQALLALAGAGAVPTVGTTDRGYVRATEYGDAPDAWIPAVLNKWLKPAQTLDPDYTLGIWFSKGPFGPVRLCVAEFRSAKAARAAARAFTDRGFDASVQPRAEGNPDDFPFHVIVETLPEVPTGVLRDRSNEISAIAREHRGLITHLTREEPAH